MSFSKFYILFIYNFYGEKISPKGSFFYYLPFRRPIVDTYFGRVVPRGGEERVDPGEEETNDVGGVADQAEDGFRTVRVEGADLAVLTPGVDKTLKQKWFSLY